MRKVYYIYNEKRRAFDRLHPTLWQRVRYGVRRFVTSLAVGAAAFFLLYALLGLPSDEELQTENDRLQAQLTILSHQMDDALNVLAEIQQRDDNLYRVMLQTEPISQEIRRGNFRSSGRYEELMHLASSELVVQTSQKMDILNKALYIQSKSFDELVELCRNNEEMIRCIPAIQPISNKTLKHTASGYGWRVDPIYGTKKFHGGMDFSANKGTAVYATGDGTVIKAGWETGYGNCVEINHGFGYVTRYAHLSAIDVKKGKKVVRGEVIGKVGSTGKSTGPHLHYEVMVKGSKVNPVNYYFMDLTAEEYDTMVQMAADNGNIYD